MLKLNVFSNPNALWVRPIVAPASWLIIRVTLGALLIHHGSNKVFAGVSGLANHLSELGWPLATLQAYAAAYTEFIGGIFLVVGLFTRVSALVNVGLFTIIVFVYHGADTFSDKESGLLFLVMSIATFLSGPGIASVDRYLFTKSEAPEKV